MKNRKKLYIFILIIALIFLIIKGITLLFSIDNNSIRKNEKKGQIQHIIVILDGYNPGYNDQFFEGLNDATSLYNIALEYWGIEAENVEENINEQLRKAALSKPDGIIVHAIKDPIFELTVQELEENGIPVITLAHDYIKEIRTSHIGYNSYELGRHIGETIQQIDFENKNIVVIESSSYDKQENIPESSNLFLGIREVTKSEANNTLKSIYHDPKNQLGTEEVILDIFENYPETNIIVTLNEDDTSGTIEKLTEMNVINQVKVIGYGKNKDILHYIERNIIDTTIFIDNYHIGYNAIEALVFYLDKKVISDSINVEIQVIDSTNVKEYRQKDE